MAKGRLFFYFVIITVFLSCRKEITQSPGQTPAPLPVDVAKHTDSAAYTLDGLTYTCNSHYGDTWSNRGANLDTSNGVWKWDADTIQYVRTYSMGTLQAFSGDRRGNIDLSFVQKFAKKDLKQTSYQFFTTTSDTLLFSPKGNRSYMMDYNRFNTENGVLLSVKVGSIGAVPIAWLSYASKDSPRFPPMLPSGIQKDSKFEIINLSFVPASDGYGDRYILEARFSCLLFDSDGNPHRLENGYVRIRVK